MPGAAGTTGATARADLLLVAPDGGFSLVDERDAKGPSVQRRDLDGVGEIAEAAVRRDKHFSSIQPAATPSSIATMTGVLSIVIFMSAPS